MRTTFPPVALCAPTLGLGGLAHAQGIPTSQPELLTIIREEVKLGRSADHERVEAGWPAAFAKAKSPVGAVLGNHHIPDPARARTGELGARIRRLRCHAAEGHEGDAEPHAGRDGDAAEVRGRGQPPRG